MEAMKKTSNRKDAKGAKEHGEIAGNGEAR
jgi:hypothetical protein